MGDIGSDTPADEPEWKIKAAAKRAKEYAKIPAAWHVPERYLADINSSSEQSVMGIPAKCGILTSRELEITETYTAVSLARAVQSGSLKAVEIATAFCKRAAIAQQLCNCLTETFFDEAIERGTWLDKYLREYKKPVGPLHGVPVSIKDCFHKVGVASTIGYISFLDEPLPTENTTLIDILIDLGAILYCKTNLPQTLMTADSDNNLFGRVLNPHKLNLTAGGSSGGEGALVAMRGSILGIGTDIGGSIRIPALCDGTYGFKPSSARIPCGGQYESRKGAPGFPAVSGPLANSMEDLEFLLKSVIDTQPWNRDLSTLPVPWRTSVTNRSLEPRDVKIGYFIEEDDLKAHPPVRRAVESTVSKLEVAGFKIVKLESFPSVAHGNDIADDWFSMEPPPKEWLHNIEKSGEPVIESIKRSWKSLNKKPEGYSVSDIFDANVARAEYKASWHKLWLDEDLDVILCPGAQTTAVLHDEYGSPPYTAAWNVLEYPGIIIPVGKADKNIDKDELASPDDKRPYCAADVHGAPLAVQLVARPYFDEELIAAAKLVDKYVKI